MDILAYVFPVVFTIVGILFIKDEYEMQQLWAEAEDTQPMVYMAD